MGRAGWGLLGMFSPGGDIDGVCWVLSGARQQHLFTPGARLRQQSGVGAWSLYSSRNGGQREVRTRSRGCGEPFREGAEECRSFCRGTAYWRRLGPARETGEGGWRWQSELWPELAVDVKGL